MACCYYRVPSRTGSSWVTMLLRARGYQFLISVATNSLRVMRLVQEHNALNQSGIAKFATHRPGHKQLGPFFFTRIPYPIASRSNINKIDCLTEPDRCHALPCQNGGSCYQEITGTYKCQCPEGFRGFNCEGQYMLVL